MTIEQSIEGFRERVAASKGDRAKVRALVAQGRWTEVEKDRVRYEAFMASHRDRNIVPSGAESIQGPTADYQSVVFLPSGADIRRSIAYVEVSDPRTLNLGTGFLVGPSLFLTNSHVIQDEDAARAASITFDRENDARRYPCPTSTFRLDPSRFALFSPPEELDLALIAVGERLSGSVDLKSLPYVVLSNRPDRHVLGMSVNIIQHPLGWPKTIAIRNNLLVARTKRTLLYETDTEVGSSGSPVFNDDWELVALHHWGHPFLERNDEAGKPLPQNVNEGVRVSAIYDYLQQMLPKLPADKRALLSGALEPATTAGPPQRTLSPPRPAPAGPETLSRTPSTGAVTMSDSRSMEATLVIPLSITIRVGDGGSASVAASVSGDSATASRALAAAPKTLSRGAEVLQIDEDYSKRKGYVSQFIPGAKIDLPAPNAAMSAQVQPLRASEPAFKEGELKYEHFSLKLHKSKRIAIFTATNIDGETYLTVDRATGEVVDGQEGDKWFKDPRVSASAYLDQTFYGDWSTYFDRGHLTRRTDPTWGTAEEAERANADTFHFTNCSPQHFRFNQTAKYWQGVERYVLENGIIKAETKKRLCVFQGPIFDSKVDLWADDVQIPSSFWKIVVWQGADRLKAVGLVVDQRALLAEERKNLGQPKDLPSVSVTHWRVKISEIERRTGLDFGKDVRDADTIGENTQPLVGGETAVPVRAWKDLL